MKLVIEIIHHGFYLNIINNLIKAKLITNYTEEIFI